MYQTDGVHIAESVDGGCTFSDVFTASQLPPAIGAVVTPATGLGSLATVRKLSMSPLGGSLAMALMETSIGGATSVEHQTLVATNVGNSWTLGQGGAPFLGRALDLTVANATVSYLLTAPDSTGLSGGGSALYTSIDGGSTWSPGSTGLAFTHLVVDPATPTTVYGFGTSGLYVSIDAGLTFTQVAGITGAVSAVAVDPTREGSVVKVALASGGLRVGVARSASSLQFSALTSSAISELDQTPGLGLTPELSAFVTDYTSAGRFYIGIDAGGSQTFSPTLDMTPSGALRVNRPQSAQGGWLQVSDSAGVWRARVGVDPVHHLPHIITPPQIGLPAVNLGPTVVRRALPAQFLPDSQTVTLHPGETQSVPLTLKLPATPTPLDVMFVIDTTSSMRPTIAGLRAGIGDIANHLAATGIDVYFGLGDFQDYPVPPFGNPGGCSGIGRGCTKPDHPYERLLAISPPGNALKVALSKVTLGDGGDGPEADLAGVYQATTGAGQDKVPGVPSAGYYVAPDLQAGFRPGAVKVIVVATDINFHAPHPGHSGTPCTPGPTVPGCDPDAGYPGPTWDQVTAALNQHNIRVVGLDVSGYPDSPATQDEAKLAKATGTLAPAGGVDCNGDGRADLPAGQPLVCGVNVTEEDTALDLTPPIVSLLRALRDFTSVRFSVASTDHHDGVATLNPPVIPAVDVKADNSLGLHANLSCPAAQVGSHELSVTATIRDHAVANGLITLNCVPNAPDPPAAVIAPLAIPIAPPPPPVQPPPQQPNPNPQANLQPGAAAEEQEDPQLAVAGTDPVAGPDDEVAMDNPGGPKTVSMSAVHATSTSGPPPGFAYFLVALSAVCAAAGTVAVARQRRAVEHSFAWVDR